MTELEEHLMRMHDEVLTTRRWAQWWLAGITVLVALVLWRVW